MSSASGYNYKDDMSFGSKAWNEYYHGRNKDGARTKSDAGHRSTKEMKRLLNTKRGNVELDDAANAIARDNYLLRQARHNLANDKAVTAKVECPEGLPTATVESLRVNGFQYSAHRGGLYWAPRTPESVSILRAALSLEPSWGE